MAFVEHKETRPVLCPNAETSSLLSAISHPWPPIQKPGQECVWLMAPHCSLSITVIGKHSLPGLEKSWADVHIPTIFVCVLLASSLMVRQWNTHTHQRGTNVHMKKHTPNQLYTNMLNRHKPIKQTHKRHTCIYADSCTSYTHIDTYTHTWVCVHACTHTSQSIWKYMQI